MSKIFDGVTRDLALEQAARREAPRMRNPQTVNIKWSKPVSHYHAVVWMDHHEARVIYFNVDEAEESRIKAPGTNHHIHSHSGTPGGTHQKTPESYLAEIAAKLADAKTFLLTGPSSAKTEFVKYIGKHAPQLFDKLDRVETLDKVSDAQLLAEARRYFTAEDRMTPRSPHQG